MKAKAASLALSFAVPFGERIHAAQKLDVLPIESAFIGVHLRLN